MTMMGIPRPQMAKSYSGIPPFTDNPHGLMSMILGFTGSSGEELQYQLVMQATWWMLTGYLGCT